MKKILIHVHLFYPEFWDDIKNSLLTICSNKSYDVKVYLTYLKKYQYIFDELNEICPNSSFVEVENRGFDTASFVKVINLVDLDDYDYVVKLHTKRNIDVSPWYVNGYDLSGDKWRKYALNFCSSKNNWNNTLLQLEKPSVGMVSDYHCIEDKNTLIDDKIIENLCEKLGVDIKNKIFCNVSMFIVKAAILKKIQHKIKFEDFEYTNRNININDSLPHKIEVVFGYLLEDKKICDFMGRKNCKLRFLILKIKKFIFYSKKTSKKHSVKIFGIPVYSRKLD